MRTRIAGVIAVVVGLLAAGGLTTATATQDGRRSYTGTIDGAEYRVEMPEDWNGTLLLYSHGYYPETWVPEEIFLATAPGSEQLLLDQGYALAGSNFRNPAGYSVADGLRDQVALLDWFDENVGRPERTISVGMSQGGVIAALLAERNPHRFDGVVTQCAEYDTPGSWNTALDIAFVVRTLLAPGEDIDLVEADDPEGSTQRLTAAVQRALETPAGRARLALAGAVANIPAWYSTLGPEPTETNERIRQQALWLANAYIWGLGPGGRVDLEARTGGNPSWNVGVDYGRLLARSSYRELAVRAYRDAGLDLGADLRRLAAAPRISADAHAVAFMVRHGLASGRTTVPVITVHNTGDGGAIPDQERWYAEQVRRHGRAGMLRQVYVDRGMHCAFNAAEEVTVLRTLLDRVETGRWPSTSPRRLNARAVALGPEHQVVLNLETGVSDRSAPPAFTRFTPDRFLRATR